MQSHDYNDLHSLLYPGHRVLAVLDLHSDCFNGQSLGLVSSNTEGRGIYLPFSSFGGIPHHRLNSIRIHATAIKPLNLRIPKPPQWNQNQPQNNILYHPLKNSTMDHKSTNSRLRTNQIIQNQNIPQYFPREIPFHLN